MWTVIRYGIYAVVVGVICAILSFTFLYNAPHWLGNNLASFLGNLFLNIGAGFVTLAAGIIFATLIAKGLAKKKLKDFAPDLVRLIGNLRIAGTINEYAARDCVICAVHVISEGSLDNVRSKESGAIADKPCVICNLNYGTEPIPGKGVRCKHCHLDGRVWESKELEGALLKSNKAKSQLE